MHKITSLVLACGLLSACKSPPAEPLEPAAIAQTVADRALEPEVLSLALTLVDRPRLTLDLDPSRFEDADAADFWQASALLYAPAMRAARRNLEAALGRLDSAGLPGPIGLSGRVLDLDDFERDRELAGSIDLLGLFGLGPTAAAEALAEARVRQAESAIEEAHWRTRFAVDLARLACARQLAFRDALEAHLADVRRTMTRFDALEKRGRLPGSAIARARAHASLLAQELARTESELDERRAELAHLVGLVPEHPMLAAMSAAALDDLDRRYTIRATPGRVELLERHPELRRLGLDYAIAEAQLRSAVAEAWPSIRVGPRAKITPDDFLTGGLIDLGIPWPGSTSGRVDAALAERARAREQIEEAFVAVLNREAAARKVQERRARSLDQDGRVSLAAANTTFQGVQARFQVDEMAWELWTDALALETNATREFWRLREDELRARIALEREHALGELFP